MSYDIEKKERLPNLTSIRFFLASMVVVFHIPEYCAHRGFPFFNDLPMLQKGTEAVFVFFSLSGFLIIRSLFLEKRYGNVNLKKFYWRRILRIFPLYYLVFSIGFLFYQGIAPKFGFTTEVDYRMTLLLGLSFFPNILATYHPGGILEVLWSIGVEEQFYIVIAPILYYLPSKKSVVALLVMTVFYFGVFHFSGFSDILLKYGLYFFYFSFSGLLAYFASKDTPFRVQSFVPYLFYGISLLIFFTNFIKDHTTLAAYNLICMVCFAFSVYFLSLKPIKLLEHQMIVKLGEISYGIYMYHVVIFQLVGFLFLKSNMHHWLTPSISIVVFNLLVFIFTFSIAFVSYHYFEKKFLKLKTY